MAGAGAGAASSYAASNYTTTSNLRGFGFNFNNNPLVFMSSTKMHLRRRLGYVNTQSWSWSLRNSGIIRCSLVEKEKKVDDDDAVSFSVEEKSLIQALLGIQGRGRSASPRQLQVIFV